MLILDDTEAYDQNQTLLELYGTRIRKFGRELKHIAYFHLAYLSNSIAPCNRRNFPKKEKKIPQPHDKGKLRRLGLTENVAGGGPRFSLWLNQGNHLYIPFSWQKKKESSLRENGNIWSSQQFLKRSLTFNYKLPGRLRHRTHVTNIKRKKKDKRKLDDDPDFGSWSLKWTVRTEI